VYFNDWSPDSKSNDRVPHAQFDSLDVGKRTMQISSLMRVIVITLLLAAARSVARRKYGNVSDLINPRIPPGLIGALQGSTEGSNIRNVSDLINPRIPAGLIGSLQGSIEGSNIRGDGKGPPFR